MVDRPHVALVTNTGWSMVRYRGELISALLERGWQVSAIADFSDQDLAHLRRRRVAPVRLELSAASQNPFKDLGYFSRLVRTLRSLQPDLVHNFSVKPVIYGSLAAKLVGIEAIVNSITGGGMLRAGERGGLQRVLRLLYRLALRGGPVVIFQNPDDLDLFVGAGLIERARTAYVAGSGVDTAALAPDWAIPPAGRTLFSSWPLACSGAKGSPISWRRLGSSSHATQAPRSFCSAAVLRTTAPRTRISSRKRGWKISIGRESWRGRASPTLRWSSGRCVRPAPWSCPHAPKGCHAP